MLTKYARLEDAQILGVAGSKDRVRTASLDKFAEFDNYRTEDGYLYARIRAISSRVNKNHDGWPSVELAGGQQVFDQHVTASARGEGFTVEASDEDEYGFSTFLGKPIFVDHHNHDPERARGVIVDSKLHVEDSKTASALDPYYAKAPDNHKPPTWVELLLEVDAKSFPRLASEIIKGAKDPDHGIDGFSMGCDVEKSVCSICKNAAHSPDDYCQHVRMKGAEFDTYDDLGNKTGSRKAYEDCYGIKFFEISAVFDPADETALTREIIHREGSVKEGDILNHDPFENIAPQRDPQHEDDQRMMDDGHLCRNCGGIIDDETHTCVQCGSPAAPRVMGPEEQKYEGIKFRHQLDRELPTVDPSHPAYNAHRAALALKQAGVEVPEALQRKLAENPLPQSDLLHKPEDLNTLREETVCPVCGSTMDEESCEICGYVEPPDGFDNPDLGLAKQEDDFNPTPPPHPGALGPDTGLTQPDALQGNNPATIANVSDEMAQWNLSVSPRIAGRINVTEKPITTSTEEQTNEPQEEIVQDQTRPVTSSVRTAREFVEAAGRGKEGNMSESKTAAEPVPAAKPDTRTDVDGVGGVADASNEQASKADAQVDVEGKGGTGVEGVAADQEGVNVAQGDEHSKNIEGTKTDTWSGTRGQTSPVQGDSYPSDAGQGAGKWSTTIPHQAYDSEPYPKDDEGLSGGSAAQGVKPEDPSVQPSDRIDVLKPVTSPENNSGPTDTWSGTDGNGVTRQQDPVTRDTLEGSDIVNLSPGTVSGVKSSAHIFAAIKLADLEVEVGLIDSGEKYDRLSELEKASPETVSALTSQATKIKDKVSAIRSSTSRVREARRVPSFSSGRTASVENSEIEDSSLFL